MFWDSMMAEFQFLGVKWAADDAEASTAPMQIISIILSGSLTFGVGKGSDSLGARGDRRGPGELER